MLSPKRTKHRKQMKQVRQLRGTETRGTKLVFGDYGMVITEAGWITNRQIEAARISISRYVKRGGKIWIMKFPDKPLTKKAAETRMGSGKGSPEQWVAVLRPGRVLFEITGVTPAIAKEAFRRAGSKLPLASSFIQRTDNLIAV